VTIDERLAAAGLPALPRRVWLEIDEAALAGNLRAVRELVGKNVAINAVVKADAYGHGLIPAARVFEAAGADRLCVASLDEALALRGAGLTLPILILFAIPPAEVPRAAEARFEVVAAEATTTIAALEQWSRQRRGDAELAIHLEVETGLSRGGLPPDKVASLVARIVATPGARLAGLWSHLATPESAATTDAQLDAFSRASHALVAAGIPLPQRHLAATGGIFTGRAPAFEGVRPGLCLYGLLPDELPTGEAQRAAAAELRPAMAVKCRALRIERLAAGTAVGYGGRWLAPRESLIATLPIGYGDGFVRAYSPGAGALVRGGRVPLVGTVAMDAVMADVSDVPEIGLEDEFVLIGEQNGSQIVTSELARTRTTIPWEVVTNMAYRLPRVYHRDSVLLGLRTLGGEARTVTMEQ
jgi:alanine racemase